MSIRLKMMSIVGVAILGIVIIVFYNNFVSQKNSVRLEEIKNVYFPVLERVDLSLAGFEKIKKNLSSAIDLSDEEVLKEGDILVNELKKTLNGVVDLSPSSYEDVKMLISSFDDYYNKAKYLTKGFLKGSLVGNELKTLLKDTGVASEKFSVELTAFRKKNYDIFMDAVNDTNNASRSAVRVGVIIGIVVSLVLALILGFMSWFVFSSIKTANALLNRVGQGDLTLRIPIKTNDEVGELSSMFNQFVENFQDIIGRVKLVSQQLTVAADNMADVTEKTSQGLSTQNRETAQVASAINVMYTNIEKVARNTENASLAASNADKEALRANHIVQQTVQEITELADNVDKSTDFLEKLKVDSGNISTVLDVIKSISEQTNLLALNAAIEAARAGEYGRGFSVVADEVRMLAKRTQDSTVQIEDLIVVLQESADTAVKEMGINREKAKITVNNASQAGEILCSIKGLVSRILELNTQIDSSLSEQSVSAKEINRNIGNIQVVAKQTSEGANRNLASSNELVKMGRQLYDEISRFKVQ